ncbi:MAG: cobalamin-dependent protein [Bacteroidota bacterium]|jgi:methanogenic corrinoid protein MtbC1
MDTATHLAQGLEQALLALDREGADRILHQALESQSPLEMVSTVVTSALQSIGEAWETGDLALSQVYMSGVICEELIDRVLPPASPSRRDRPKMAIGVFEDYHLLGKRIIYSTLRAAGFELMDLGGGLQTKDLLRIVREEKIRILLLSVLMLPSALHIKDLVAPLADEGVILIVGGAPFRLDTELWKEIGANATARDSAETLSLISQLVEGL